MAVTYAFVILGLAAGSLAASLPAQVCSSGNCPDGTAAIFGWGGRGDWVAGKVPGHTPTMVANKKTGMTYNVKGTSTHPANNAGHYITAMYVVDQDLNILATETFSKTATTFAIDKDVDMTSVSAFAVVLHCNLHGVWASQPMVLKKTDCLNVPWPNALPQIDVNANVTSEAAYFGTSAQGGWVGKSGSHTPKNITVDGGKVSVIVPHSSSTAHWIGGVFVMDGEGRYLACEMYEAGNKDNALSVETSLTYKSSKSANASVMSWCNLHGTWRSDSFAFSVNNPGSSASLATVTISSIIFAVVAMLY